MADCLLLAWLNLFIYIYFTFPLAVWPPPNAACCKQFAKWTENGAESCKVKRLQGFSPVLFVFGNSPDLFCSLDLWWKAVLRANPWCTLNTTGLLISRRSDLAKWCPAALISQEMTLPTRRGQHCVLVHRVQRRPLNCVKPVACGSYSARLYAHTRWHVRKFRKYFNCVFFVFFIVCKWVRIPSRNPFRKNVREAYNLGFLITDPSFYMFIDVYEETRISERRWRDRWRLWWGYVANTASSLC